MGSMFEMMKRIFRMRFPWNAWVGVLLLANVAGGLIFISQPEGKAALAATMVGALVMWGVFARLGFVRLLGLGHIVGWLPLNIFLLGRLDDVAGGMHTWIITIIILNGMSLMIDVVDVFRYIAGDRHVMT
ncbi:MAG: hypothetical protein SF187_02265 [Deltaproteobacteria bacterium]|nr:hypothetical protein [Deltaproteobacteria bacterium]